VGWREITAVGADGTAVTGSTVPAASPSDLLRAYPQDLLASPLNIRVASFAFGPGTQAVTPNRPPAGVERPGLSGGPLAGLVARGDLSPGLVLLAMAVALGVGALHAMAPGHGKTVTAAYLAGGVGGARHAIQAGAAVALMHTTSVLALGGLILAARQAFPAERVYPWLGVLAGVAAVALGVGLLAGRLRRRDDPHDHGHGHPPLSRRGLAGLALSGGLLPSPTAIVVLLASASLGRLALGLGLVALFGLGLAASLTAVGVVAVRARDALDRRLPGRLARALPVASAGTIAAMGLALTARAVAQLAG
jgi:ABC-type nickel/cobalt efflux system permease component RcnA